MNLLQQPFPLQKDRKTQIISTTLLSIGIFFILFVFQPFGISLLPAPTIFPVVLGYAILCFLVVIFNRLPLMGFFPKLFEETNWKVYKEIIWYCYNIFSVGIANFLYSYWLGFFSLHVDNILRMLFITFLVAILPMIILIFIRYNYLLNRNLKHAIAFNQAFQHYHKQHELSSVQETSTQNLPTQVILNSEEKSGNLSLDISQLLYIEADDNYLEVVYTQEGKIQKSILRNTLKNMESTLLAYEEIFRCHRSYLVNLQNVEEITGNSQGYRLVFKNTDFQVPVARSAVKELKEKMQQQK
ncbi:MAG: LytTR family transcriptional regulator DNA-binding domain-containing protein [Thermoflexibacter sp.]|nr:LytTR family transcriptional regulator DNA-binding domain-containing protein [Thermoflexibacter sp.]